MGSFEPVSLLKCETYEYSEVRKALEKSLSFIHGLDFIKDGMVDSVAISTLPFAISLPP